jgi:hypothetical protein
LGPYRRLPLLAGRVLDRTHRLDEGLKSVLLAVTLDVERGDAEEVRLVPEQSQALVASLTQEGADLAGRVIVVQMLW